MIITQTPFRISFVGGGTDFSDFFRAHGGAVLSSAIDKYLYVIVQKRYFDDLIYVNYSQKEIVDDVEKLEHRIVRECMKKTGVLKGVEITTVADIPIAGTGLGSSSSLTVGLLNALYLFRGIQKSTEELAAEACEIEIEKVKSPIGIQDQYIAAYGGLKRFDFNKNGTVTTKAIDLPENRFRLLSHNLMLFYTHKTRKSETILSEQKTNIDQRQEELLALKELVTKLEKSLLSEGNLDEFGQILNENWELKKKLTGKISSPDIDAMYQKALNAGAIGGKIAGAGGGGVLLLYCPPEKQNAVRKILPEYRELHFHLAHGGSQPIFIKPD
ncbi:MAG: GHMP kinase [Candidatus Magasanikbacteria bacterium RIFCSPHIGHO2_01_FULL_47_8]|uniref:GHMP kinase n=1 Tax=Candidatus Magasanikbacteria bacterium RIFCSPHIGHO2_01_FULL_47_8 TaxID=1798673 RepID=A0A1F6MB04_9BACT|nr:MAG: GHMP kinase [Candidatus Magasanikbacteria bacterium RIFCSPHIGHO2_01_FULL_47_8]